MEITRFDNATGGMTRKGFYLFLAVATTLFVFSLFAANGLDTSATVQMIHEWWEWTSGALTAFFGLIVLLGVPQIVAISFFSGWLVGVGMAGFFDQQLKDVYSLWGDFDVPSARQNKKIKMPVEN